MMPTAVAIVEVVYPVEKRGSALGVLAGGSAFFAALGPVLGGLLTGIDWRLVFWINVPLAIITIALTLAFTPPLTPTAAKGGIDRWGIVTFAIGLVGLVYGLGEVSATSLTDPQVLIPVAIGVLALVIFVFVERAQTDPMIDFRLLRKRNLLAANISQFLAGSIELGLGFLLPYFYLLAVGISPQAAGLALLPATVPIILAGPLAGKAYDKVGPRLPLVLGFLVLAASGVALAAATSALSPWAMIPGLLLQGAGLGIVLTVNDPTGLGAVSESDSGQAAGMLNTSEQFGGAVGIAVLGALELDYYRGQLYDKLADRGLFPNAQQAEQFRDFILDAEQYGVRHTPKDASVVQVALADSIASRIPAFELTFLVTSGISLLGAVVVLALIKSGRPHHPVGVFSRRSRWVLDKNDRTDALPAAQRPGS